MKRRPVKRAYDASGRQEAAARRRSAILHAARKLFIAHGYAGTTMADIADAVKIALDTIYASVGTKQVLFRALIEAAISGTDQAIPAAERDYVKAIIAEPDARQKLTLYAHALRRIHERLAPLTVVLKEAASADAELGELWTSIANRRAANMRRFAADLAATGQLRHGLDVAEAADVIWAMNAPEFYVLLVADRGWSPEKFEAWLARAWIQLLISADGSTG
ncbi:MAG: helix-turn-helix domain-containing protein, partial [Pseudomonadota bacterium]